MMIKVKNHQTLPTNRPETDLMTTLTTTSTKKTTTKTRTRTTMTTTTTKVMGMQSDVDGKRSGQASSNISSLGCGQWVTEVT